MTASCHCHSGLVGSKTSLQLFMWLVIELPFCTDDGAPLASHRCFRCLLADAHHAMRCTQATRSAPRWSFVAALPIVGATKPLSDESTTAESTTAKSGLPRYGRAPCDAHQSLAPIVTSPHASRSAPQWSFVAALPMLRYVRHKH